MRLDQIVLPETRLARSALEVATAYSSPAFLHHSARSYLWAAAHGLMNGVAFDPELLYVSALLHDIGLTQEFDSHVLAFEEAGGHLAWVFAAGAGWPVERRQRSYEVIVLHMRDDVPADVDPEAHLLQVAVSLDVSGRRPEEFPEGLRAEVLARYPRLGFGEEFMTQCRAQALRKPASAAAAALRNGLAARVAGNPLDQA